MRRKVGVVSWGDLETERQWWGLRVDGMFVCSGAEPLFYNSRAEASHAAARLRKKLNG